jgi:hypothetical protein
MHTISFCILDDCRPAYGPIHESFSGSISEQPVKSTVRSILQAFLDSKYDPSKYYHERINQDEINCITSGLCSENYYVHNRFEKYYVIAFAIDFTRFEVFSRDCDKRLIKWRENDEADPITGIITNDDYNISPVIKMLKLYGGYGIIDRSDADQYEEFQKSKIGNVL